MNTSQKNQRSISRPTLCGALFGFITFDDGNGRTARAASYLVLCVKLGYRLPGKKSLVDLIVGNKPPYWAALEAADAAWADNGRIDVSALEDLLENLLGAQLVSVLEDAKGQSIA